MALGPVNVSVQGQIVTTLNFAVHIESLLLLFLLLLLLFCLTFFKNIKTILSSQATQN